ncbi:hypothetical protein MA03_01245 [Infirmifilum uzonense]|uniref:Damage-control phosphatase ARMT1-like metal-binding domain-containing protein n=1 Tax=Infirmifilum uzonense TaxID=1550241 RepID=A0A0F7FGJ0_9CREN|nr:ARMT1-like domain-containing protein [Infirmifilum uzonense]AKG38185.1 hypothetical protein MA03_01245 [Infirmifilum uzonense]
MKIAPECIQCIFDVRAKEITSASLSDHEKILKLKSFLDYYSQIVTPDTSTTLLSWQAFRKVKELMGSEDPYTSFKTRSHQVAVELLSVIEREIKEKIGFERFHYAVKASIAANLVDPGTPSGIQPEALGEKIRGLRLAIDESEKLYMRLLQSSKVTFLLDNCGEALLDTLLIREIKRMGVELKIVVKGKPYQNDITYKEALEYGFNSLGEVVSTGSDFPGVIPGYVSEEAVKALEWADVIISKGMANYEAFLLKPPSKPVFIMLVAKCEVIARAVGVQKGEAVAFFLQGSPDLKKLF